MSQKGMVRLPYDRKFCLGDYAPMAETSRPRDNTPFEMSIDRRRFNLTPIEEKQLTKIFIFQEQHSYYQTLTNTTLHASFPRLSRWIRLPLIYAT